MIAKKPWPKLSRDHGETCLWTIQKELVFEIRQCLCFDLSHVVSTHNFSRLGAQHSFCTVTQNRLHAVQFDLQWTLKQLWLPKDITRRHADTKLGQETDVSELGSKLFKDQKLYDHSSVEPSRRAQIGWNAVTQRDRLKQLIRNASRFENGLKNVLNR